MLVLKRGDPSISACHRSYQEERGIEGRHSVPARLFPIRKREEQRTDIQSLHACSLSGRERNMGPTFSPCTSAPYQEERGTEDRHSVPARLFPIRKREEQRTDIQSLHVCPLSGKERNRGRHSVPARLFPFRKREEQRTDIQFLHVWSLSFTAMVVQKDRL